MQNIILEDWDPLALGSDDPGIVSAAQKREIQNILKSYTGYYDLFSELIQNSLDAVEKRMRDAAADYQPSIWITIDIKANSVTVTDNGCGMNVSEFKGFMKPNFSFKDGSLNRGNKGVGATYLAFGFNSLTVATKQSEDSVLIGHLREGRNWLEDTRAIITKPKVTRGNGLDPSFGQIDSGTTMTLRLSGSNIRPKNLAYFSATNAEQWLAILRVHTPLGGIYLCGQEPPRVRVSVKVISATNAVTEKTIESPRYLYPHEVMGKTADLREFLADQEAKARRQVDISKIPPKFTNLNGIWGEWSGQQILDGLGPIKPRLDDAESELLRQLGLTLYVFMGFSTDLWDAFNDQKLELRKGSRLIKGGLQQATRHMPQGNPVTIPLTENIGFQNITHIIIHFDNAEPDLGRKGFQPEHTKLAERISIAAVTAFKKYFQRLLRGKTGAPALMQGVKLDQWIDEQKSHEKEFPLVITGRGLFEPAEELPIRSIPLVEQDVVALFNQMLSSGLIRGIQLLSSSQFNQYDGLYRFKMVPPFQRYIYSETNPLGADETMFAGASEPVESRVSVLEYKYNMDSLIEEFSTGEKKAHEIGLAVVWDMGDRWKGMFDIISYLEHDNLHHRQFHGITHALHHSSSGLLAFPVIVLKDLIAYCVNPAEESERQRVLYSQDTEL